MRKPKRLQLLARLLRYEVYITYSIAKVTVLFDILEKLYIKATHVTFGLAFNQVDKYKVSAPIKTRPEHTKSSAGSRAARKQSESANASASADGANNDPKKKTPITRL